MADFDPSIAADVVAACQAGAAETSSALSRSLDASIELTVGEAETFDAATAADQLAGPGLAVLLTVGGQGAVAVLAEKSGLLPDWYRKPDATGASKLATLAQELGMLLLPEQFMPDDFRAAFLPDLGEALARAGIATGAGLVPLLLKAGEKQGAMWLAWPASSPGALYDAPVVAEPPPASAPPVQAAAAPASPPPVEPASRVKPAAAPPALQQLPPYTRSLLRIRVPVVVTLANKRQPLAKIVELRPGSIIQFNKSCEEMLELEVNQQVVAEGECVKAGDKFGLRITAMTPPAERFRAVGR